MFALLVAIEPMSLYSVPERQRLPREIERVAKLLAAKLDVARLMRASPSPTFDRDFRRPRALAPSTRARVPVAESVARGRFSHPGLHHLGRAAGGLRKAIALEACIERALRLFQHHVQRRQLVERRGAPVGIALLLGERQRLLQRAKRLFQVTAVARGDADRHRGPVLEIGIGSPVQQLAGLLREAVRPGGVARRGARRWTARAAMSREARFQLACSPRASGGRRRPEHPRCSRRLQRPVHTAHRCGGARPGTKRPRARAARRARLGALRKSVKRRLDCQRLARDRRGRRRVSRRAANGDQHEAGEREARQYREAGVVRPAGSPLWRPSVANQSPPRADSAPWREPLANGRRSQ
jgi:hypothetical protein